MTFVPYSLVMAGILFTLSGILKVLDRPGFPAPSRDAFLRAGRRKAHLLMFVVGFFLIWAGVFLLIRGYR
jgi:uncharacterized membrane protein YphA (DoxX/SURF4 family)